MAEYNNHSMDYIYDGIDRYTINKKSANSRGFNLIAIDNISFDGDEYEVEITLSNLSDDVKDNLRSKNGSFFIEVGRMRSGSNGLAGYQRPHEVHGHRKVSMITHPNHHFRANNSFAYTIPNRELDSPHTYTLYLSEYDLIGMEGGNDECDTIRYKNKNIARSWSHILIRTRFRMRLNMNNQSCPYRLNSEEIVTYNNFH